MPPHGLVAPRGAPVVPRPILDRGAAGDSFAGVIATVKGSRGDRALERSTAVVTEDAI